MNFLDPKQLTQEKVEQLWEKVQSIETFSDDRMKGRADLFVKMLYETALHIELEDVGFLRISNIFVGAEALVHIVIWDRSEPHRVVRLLKEALVFIFKELQLERATTSACIQNVEILRLAALLGFKEEGCMRRACLHKGEYNDVVLLGILKEDVLPE